MNTPTPMNDKRKASFALDTIRQLERELTAAREEINTLKTMCISNANEANDLRQQRDRLAAVVNRWRKGKHSGEYGVALRRCISEIDEALQSLNQDHTVDANDMIAAVKGENHES